MPPDPRIGRRAKAAPETREEPNPRARPQVVTTPERQPAPAAPVRPVEAPEAAPAPTPAPEPRRVPGQAQPSARPAEPAPVARTAPAPVAAPKAEPPEPPAPRPTEPAPPSAPEAARQILDEARAQRFDLQIVPLLRAAVDTARARETGTAAMARELAGPAGVFRLSDPERERAANPETLLAQHATRVGVPVAEYLAEAERQGWPVQEMVRRAVEPQDPAKIKTQQPADVLLPFAQERRARMQEEERELPRALTREMITERAAERVARAENPRERLDVDGLVALARETGQRRRSQRQQALTEATTGTTRGLDDDWSETPDLDTLLARHAERIGLTTDILTRAADRAGIDLRLEAARAYAGTPEPAPEPEAAFDPERPTFVQAPDMTTFGSRDRDQLAEAMVARSPESKGFALADALIAAEAEAEGAGRRVPQAIELYAAYGDHQNFVKAQYERLLRRERPREGENDDDFKRRLYSRALNTLLAAKTVGAWVPPIYLSEDEMRDPRLIGQAGLGAALSPTVELLGFNNSGGVVYRMESPGRYVNSLIDTPNYALAGALDPDLTMTEAIALRYDTGQAALNSDFARTSTAHAAFAGALGYSALIFSPDLLSVGVGTVASVPTVGRSLARATTLSGARRVADDLDQLARLREAGSLVEAERIESRLRRAAPQAMDELDRVDSAVARMVGQVAPDTQDVGLATRQAGSLGDRFTGLAPGARRREAAIQAGERHTTIPYKDLFATDDERRAFQAEMEGASRAATAAANEDFRSIGRLLGSDAEKALRGSMDELLDNPDAWFDDAAGSWLRLADEGDRTDVLRTLESIRTQSRPMSERYALARRGLDATDANNTSRAAAARIVSERIRSDYGLAATRPMANPRIESFTRNAIRNLFGPTSDLDASDGVLDVLAGAAADAGLSLRADDLARMVDETGKVTLPEPVRVYAPTPEQERRIRILQRKMQREAASNMARAEEVLARISEMDAGLATVLRRTLFAAPDAKTWTTAARGLVKERVADKATRAALYKQVGILGKEVERVRSAGLRAAANIEEMQAAATIVKAEWSPEDLSALQRRMVEGKRVREAEERAAVLPELSREATRASRMMVDTFGLPEAEAAAWGSVADAMARSWAKRVGKDPSEWWAMRFGGVERADALPAGALGQPGAAGAVRFLGDGRAIIYALKDADISTGLHELAHIARRDLDADDLDTIATWCRANGADVVADGQGGFRGATDAVRRAEELFARGFERYLRDGSAPNTALRQVFDAIKSWLRDIYKTIRGTDLDLELTDDVRAVYDRLLGVEDELAQATGRVPLIKPQQAVREDVATDWLRAALADNELRIDAEQVGGKTVYRVVDVRDPKGKSATFDTEEAAAAFLGSFDTAKERIRKGLLSAASSYLFGKAKKVGRFSLHITIGGDPDSFLRALPPQLRMDIKAGERVVANAIGEAISLSREADEAKFFRYLSGDRNVVFGHGGRPPLSRGYDAMGWFNASVRRAWDRLDPLEQERLAAYVTAEDLSVFRAREIRMARAGASDPEFAAATYAAAYERFMHAPDRPQFMTDVMNAIGLPKTGTDADITPAEIRFAESMLYHAGITKRNGLLFNGSSRDAAAGLLGDARNLFGAGIGDVHFRIGVQIVSHAQAARIARGAWSEMGMFVSGDVAKAFKSWVNGEQVPAELLPEVLRLAERMGINPHFQRASQFNDYGDYLPVMARARLSSAIVRALPEEEQFDAAREAGKLLLRYWKTRVTRGSFVPRRRYFWVNSFDHFNQVALEAGFGTALQSVSRLTPQNLLAEPGVAQMVDIARSVSSKVLGRKVGETWIEDVRRVLQKAGDGAARAIGKIFGLSKYRVEVSRVIEGSPDAVRLGGRVYTYQDLREIGVEEGIHGSYNSLLSPAIERDLRRSGRWNDFKNAAGYPMRMTEEIAEAWSVRERYGLMITLVEAGIEPRTAARLTVKALYDYPGSMSKADRMLLVQLIQPFWAYTKNANAQFVNALFSPWGVYRLNVIRKKGLYGPQFLNELMYQSLVDSYGVDESALTPEARDAYYALRTRIEEHYGGPDNVPEDVRMALVLLLSDATYGAIERGGMNRRLYELPANVQALMQNVGIGSRNAVIRRPADASKSSYARWRPGYNVPLAKTDSFRRWAEVVAGGSDDVYMSLLMPESSVQMSLNYLATQLAAVAYITSRLDALGPELFTEPDDGFGDAVNISDILGDYMDGTRAPLVGDVLRNTTLADVQYPKRIAKPIYDILERIMPELVSATEARGDAGEVVQEPTYWLMSGWARAMFEFMQLDEVNGLLLATEGQPFGATGRSEAYLSALRKVSLVTGMSFSPVVPPKTVRREEPTQLVESRRISR